jgi:acyl carrier protein
MQAAAGIEDQVRALLTTQLGVEQADITPDASLVQDLGADSLDMAALIIAVEDEFGIDIADEEAATLVTVKQLLEYVAFAAAARIPPALEFDPTHAASHH